NDDDHQRNEGGNCYIELRSGPAGFEEGAQFSLAVRAYSGIGAYAVHFYWPSDQFPEGYEECDDGNLDDSDGCNRLCRQARCGDGILRDDLSEGEPGYEECDDGNLDDHDACRNDCRRARCGDGVRRTDRGEGAEGFEACDDGEANGLALDDEGNPLPVNQRALAPCGEDCRPYPNGMSAQQAAPSCASLQRTLGPDLESGNYWIETPKLVAPGLEATRLVRQEVWCDFDRLEGGWTQCVRLSAETGVPRHFFSQCAGLRPLGRRPHQALIKVWHDTLGSASGLPPDQSYLLNGMSLAQGQLPNDRPVPGAIAQEPVESEFLEIFQGPPLDVERWLPDDPQWVIPEGPYHYDGPRRWHIQRHDGVVLEEVEGDYLAGLGDVSKEQTVMIARRPRLQLDSGSGDACAPAGGVHCPVAAETCVEGRCQNILMEQMADAELCLGCFAAAGQSPTCQDQPVDPERQLLWKGPLAGLCLSSSRYTADGMFLSRTVRRGDTLATEWLPTGAVEIFYREVDEAELVRDEDNRP
ncbi:MAG: hypothetical protein CMH55_07805, partial [Myxococcales bacterium]|nr:hypothetical protein [Myxococcales bacterium]